MDRSDVLQRIPFEASYTEKIENYNKYHNFYYDHSGGAVLSVNTTFWNNFDDEMDENGLCKFALMLSGLLFEIEHGEVDPDQAYGTAWDILDFETGNYDDLCTEEDLRLIRGDIAKAKEYFALHPEMLEGLEKGRAEAQSE